MLKILEWAKSFDLTLSIFLIASIIIGFFLQAILTWLKEHSSVHYETQIFKECGAKEEEFPLKNNKLRTDTNQLYNARYFSDRCAFWGHMSVGSILLLIIYILNLAFQNEINPDRTLLVCLLLVSLFGYFFRRYYRKKEIRTVIG